MIEASLLPSLNLTKIFYLSYDFVSPSGVCCPTGHTQPIMAPRITWDKHGMAVYSALHPDVLDHRKVGEPSIQIRARSQRRA